MGQTSTDQQPACVCGEPMGPGHRAYAVSRRGADGVTLQACGLQLSLTATEADALGWALAEGRGLAVIACDPGTGLLPEPGTGM